MCEMDLDCMDLNIFSVPQMSMVSYFFTSDANPLCNVTVNKTKFTLVHHGTGLFRYLKSWSDSSSVMSGEQEQQHKVLPGYTINFGHSSRLHSSFIQVSGDQINTRTSMDGTQLQRKNQIYICFPLHPKTTCHRKTVFHTEIQIDMQLILESLMEINNRRQIPKDNLKNLQRNKKYCACPFNLQPQERQSSLSQQQWEPSHLK